MGVALSHPLSTLGHPLTDSRHRRSRSLARVLSSAAEVHSRYLDVHTERWNRCLTNHCEEKNEETEKPVSKFR